MTNFSTWTFETTNDSYLAAEFINRPHEDFPRRVQMTKLCIDQFVNTYDDHPDLVAMGRLGFRINPMTLWIAHSLVFPEAKNHWYRRVPVIINGVAIPHETIPENIERISDDFMSEQALREWYVAFQRIHPFEDGNGRVGGIELAAGSFVLTGRYTYHVQPDWTEPS